MSSLWYHLPAAPQAVSPARTANPSVTLTASGSGRHPTSPPPGLRARPSCQGPPTSSQTASSHHPTLSPRGTSCRSQPELAAEDQEEAAAEPHQGGASGWPYLCRHRQAWGRDRTPGSRGLPGGVATQEGGQPGERPTGARQGPQGKEAVWPGRAGAHGPQSPRRAPVPVLRAVAGGGKSSVEEPRDGRWAQPGGQGSQAAERAGPGVARRPGKA